MTRLFVGLRPPAPVRDVLLGAMGGVERARWQDEDQLHLTLRFVGEIDAPLANDLAAALAQVDAAPFDLRITGVGHFERKGRATTLWAGLAASPQLLAFQQKIERACQRVGLAPEGRKFAPHVTLARLNTSAGPIGGWLAAHGALTAPPWRVEEFRLYESVLTPAGSAYTWLRRRNSRHRQPARESSGAPDQTSAIASMPSVSARWTSRSATASSPSRAPLTRISAARSPASATSAGSAPPWCSSKKRPSTGAGRR